MKPLPMILALFSCISCAVMRNTYYLSEKNTAQQRSGHLLFGIDSENWKTPWKINNVAQYEVNGLLIATTFENYYHRYWATGILVIPILPLFGMKSFFGSMEGQETTNRIKIAIYSRSQKPIHINPCEIIISPALFRVNSFNYYHRETVLVNEPCRSITIEDWADVAVFHVNLSGALGVEDTSIEVKGILVDGKPLSVPKMEFTKSSGFEWTSWL